MGNGALYIGQFINGLREVLWTFTWSKYNPAPRKSYEGELRKGQKYGKGKFIYDTVHVEEGN